MNIFEELRKDHDHQRELLASLAETKGDSKTRHEIFDELKKAMLDHAVAEERHFYVPLIEKDLTQEKARHSIAEHHELDEYIETLEDTDMSSSSWMATFKKLEHKLLHHLEEEEKQIFPVAGKVLSESKKTSLASDYDKEMEKAKAH